MIILLMIWLASCSYVSSIRVSISGSFLYYGVFVIAMSSLSTYFSVYSTCELNEFMR